MRCNLFGRQLLATHNYTTTNGGSIPVLRSTILIIGIALIVNYVHHVEVVYTANWVSMFSYSQVYLPKVVSCEQVKYAER